MLPVHKIALAHALSTADANVARDVTPPGAYDVDFTVRVRGSVRVGEDYDQRIAAKADAWGLLAVALSKLNGVTIESIVAEALAGSLATDEVKAAAQRAIAAVKVPTVTRCRGRVTPILDVELLAANLRAATARDVETVDAMLAREVA